MKYNINLDVYHDGFEPIFFDGLTSTESIYKACKKAVNYCQTRFERPCIVDVFIEVNGSVRPVYVGEVRIGIAQAISIYRMYTAIINKLGEVL